MMMAVLLVDLKAGEQGLEFLSIQLEQVSGRTEPIIKVYADGSYQKGNNHVKVLGTPVKVAAMV